MPKKARQLAPFEVRRIKRPGLHAVGGVDGLYLNVKPSGSRSWIQRVVVGGRRRELGLGSYPTVTLEQARDTAREYRRQVREGTDPVATRRDAQEALRAAEAKRRTFNEAALACWRSKSKEFKNAKHRAQWISTLKRYASPVIGLLPVDRIEIAHVLRVLEPIWESKTETASRLRGRIEAVLSWATVSEFRSGENPARWKDNLEHKLPKPSKVKRVVHHPALPWQEIGNFMADLKKRESMAPRALEFAILTAARSMEVRLATWDEMDLDLRLWTVPAEHMKAGRIHRVPLSKPAVALLKELPRFEESPFVFAAARGGSLSDSTLSSLTREMRINAVPHGFRSTFKDWCRSSTYFADEVSELALAHVSNDATRAAYARDELLPKRARLMEEWANFCGTVPQSGEVVPIRHGRQR